MRSVRLALFLLVLPAALVSAQTPSSRPPVVPVQRPVAAGGASEIDQLQLLRGQVDRLADRNRALEGRVTSLEGALRDMRAQTGFTCSARATSRRGDGRTEDCAPYACNEMDGRCRTRAAVSGHCATGFNWVAGDSCVPAQPSGG
jgi:hypothetical protein